MRSMVAGRAELSQSLFVARSHDVIGMRHWRDFCFNAQKWREKSSTFRQMSKEREQEVFEEKMSERGSLQFGGERENVLKDQREGQATKGRLERKRQGVAVKRSSETSEQREEGLTAKRKRAAFERSNESSEEREERLAAQRKQAAVKRSNESSKEREELLRAERERAAAKRARETSQEKELRLRSGRERAALKRPCPLGRVETNRRSQSRRDSDNRRRNQREAIFAARRNGYLHNRGWADPENRGLHHEEWAQEEMAAFHSLRGKPAPLSLCRLQRSMAAVCFPRGVIYLLEMQERQRSRVDYILLRTTWILEASQQNYKASVKSRNC